LEGSPDRKLVILESTGAQDVSSTGETRGDKTAVPDRHLACDFKRHGKQDLVAGYNVLFGNGKGDFGTAVEVTGLDGEPAVTADFNGDGVSDIATFGNVSNYVTVILSNGNGTFQDPKNYFAGPEIACLAVGDFNGDGKPDLAVCAGTFVVVLLGSGDGTFQSPIDTSLPYTTSGICVFLPIALRYRGHFFSSETKPTRFSAV
jgi:hypothetical protein